MYGIFTYIWLTFVVHVGRYTLYGYNGILKPRLTIYLRILASFKPYLTVTVVNEGL